MQNYVNLRLSISESDNRAIKSLQKHLQTELGFNKVSAASAVRHAVNELIKAKNITVEGENA